MGAEIRHDVLIPPGIQASNMNQPQRVRVHYNHGSSFEIGAGDRPEMFDPNFIPSPVICDFIMKHIDTGIRSVDNVPYPVSVGGSELFHLGNPDTNGYRRWRAIMYLRGIYVGYGEKNNYPKSGEHETLAYATLTYLPWESGKVIVNLSTCGEEHRKAALLYEQTRFNPRMREAVESVYGLIKQFRQPVAVEGKVPELAPTG